MIDPSRRRERSTTATVMEDCNCELYALASHATPALITAHAQKIIEPPPRMWSLTHKKVIANSSRTTCLLSRRYSSCGRHLVSLSGKVSILSSGHSSEDSRQHLVSTGGGYLTTAVLSRRTLFLAAVPLCHALITTRLIIDCIMRIFLDKERTFFVQRHFASRRSYRAPFTCVISLVWLETNWFSNRGCCRYLWSDEDKEFYYRKTFKARKFFLEITGIFWSGICTARLVVA